jgi:hypothetical protein
VETCTLIVLKELEEQQFKFSELRW